MSDKIPDFQKIAKELILDAQTIVEVEMVNFVMSNFQKQGFTDSGFTPWQKRKNNADPGRAILVKSGALMKSVKITESKPDRVVLSATAKHAQIHNEGGTINIPINDQMRKFFWIMYKRTKEGKWKGMALTKKSHFNTRIPKRQFMGESKSFDTHIENLFFKKIIERFTQHS
jgi:phage gpG-like protein